MSGPWDDDRVSRALRAAAPPVDVDGVVDAVGGRVRRRRRQRRAAVATGTAVFVGAIVVVAVAISGGDDGRVHLADAPTTSTRSNVTSTVPTTAIAAPPSTAVEGGIMVSSIVDRAQIPGVGDMSALTRTADAVWIARPKAPLDSTMVGPHYLVRMGPDGEVAATTALEGTPARGIVHGDSLWVVVVEPVVTGAPDWRLKQINASTGRLEHSIEVALNGKPLGIAVAADGDVQIWTFDSRFDVNPKARVTTSTSILGSPSETAPDTSKFDASAWGEGHTLLAVDMGKGVVVDDIAPDGSDRVRATFPRSSVPVLVATDRVWVVEGQELVARGVSP